MSWGALAADALVVLGVAVMTIGVYGVFRMPDTYTQLHAASKAVVLGVIALLVASLATGDATVVARSALIAVFLIATTPVAAHVIGRAAYLQDERMATPGARDESGHRLTEQPPPPDPDRELESELLSRPSGSP
ncbi:MAG TPA: monovalent cation/H(+) antiporter subunit G [Gaiellaceae bacterium]|nr:monovalent cation/H(+) antiporter subunit G [Gaiellaceae bacterium]